MNYANVALIVCALSLLFFGAYTASAGNITVYEYGSNYIIWSIAENISSVYIDGEEIEITSPYYGQYSLQPNSEHIGCDAEGNCISVTTLTDGYTVFIHWSVYLVLIFVCAISFWVPLSYAFAVIYSLYLIGDYLPSISAPYTEFVLVVALMVIGIVLAHRGYNRHV